MSSANKIYSFAIKWCNKFQNPEVTERSILDHYLADDCRSLGFQMDCGRAFEERYGNAAHDSKALEQIITTVDDIALLGSAIYSRWRYFNHWAMGESVLEEKNRTWFVTALTRLAELTSPRCARFSGTLQKMKLVSNSLSYGPMPKPEDEIEQRITINRSGRIWYSTYNFGYSSVAPQKSNMVHTKIDKRDAAHLLDTISSFFSNGYDVPFATDVGDWHLYLTNTDGISFTFTGSLCSDLRINELSLSSLLRRITSIPGLFAFDGEK